MYIKTSVITSPIKNVDLVKEKILKNQEKAVLILDFFLLELPELIGY